MYYDALIIGNGIAGSSLAIFLAESGQRVLLVTKGESFEDTNTHQAQGGIVYRGVNDTWKLLYNDIINASDHTSSEMSSRVVARIGPTLVKRLFIQKLRVPFEQDENGEWNLFQEAAHSRRRILHVKDCTGRAIQKALNEGVLREHLIDFKKNTWAVGLILSSQYQIDPHSRFLSPECHGVYLLDARKGEIMPVFARATVLATGGLNSLYRHATGGDWNTGDGYAIAARAGVTLQNMEYIQFHPTLLYAPDYKQAFLVSEAFRGEGAELVNEEGKSFMRKYHPLGSLGPRDVIARAIFQEMQSRNTHCVYLDLCKKMTSDAIRDT
ncbi:MAG: FAD-dependent oxidoreductase, partial [Candidatus Atribacteria bacterium]|nr:FAD-dependent oxidoreductase [Candidatus Atribacteria bacterium]